MRIHPHTATLSLLALVLLPMLGACDKRPALPPAPVVGAVQGAPAPGPGMAGAAGDVSVPSAGSVLVPAPPTRVDPTAGRSNNTMSPAQESAAMPMPGQNNDHSAPLGPAKRASGP